MGRYDNLKPGYKASEISTGGEEVDKNRRVLEVERITNLVRGFGWDLQDTKEENDVLTLTIKKTVSSEPLTPV